MRCWLGDPGRGSAEDRLTPSTLVIAGLDPAIKRSGGDLGPEVAPAGVGPLDQRELPVAPPFLERFLALDGCARAFSAFEPDKPLYAVSTGKSGPGVGPMFVDAAHKVVRYADVERAVTLAGHDVDEHLAALLDRRIKSGDDRVWWRG